MNLKHNILLALVGKANKPHRANWEQCVLGYAMAFASLNILSKNVEQAIVNFDRPCETNLYWSSSKTCNATCWWRCSLVDHLGNALTHGDNDSTHKSMKQIIMSWSCSYSRKSSQPASQPRYCPLSKGLLTRHWIWPDKQNRCAIANCQITGLVPNKNPSASCIIQRSTINTIQRTAKLCQRNSKEAAKLKVFQKREREM